jgi:uncharacterized protein YegL
MKGEPITAVAVALQAMMSSLLKDPYALETVHLSLITFDMEARELMPLTPLDQVRMPAISAPDSGATMMGAALELLGSLVDRNVLRNTPERKGDWRPLLFIMTDGSPSDLYGYRNMIPEIKSKGFARIIGCAAGPKAKSDFLLELTPEVLRLDTMDSSSFEKFFEWVSLVIEVAGSAGSSAITELPPPPDEFQIVH